jgi:hypothetical protein
MWTKPRAVAEFETPPDQGFGIQSYEMFTSAVSWTIHRRLFGCFIWPNPHLWYCPMLFLMGTTWAVSYRHPCRCGACVLTQFHYSRVQRRPCCPHPLARIEASAKPHTAEPGSCICMFPNGTRRVVPLYTRPMRLGCCCPQCSRFSSDACRASMFANASPSHVAHAVYISPMALVNIAPPRRACRRQWATVGP